MSIQNVSIETFNIFATVEKYGSISKAAEILLIDQSSISRRIKQLERKVEADLFERNSRGVQLTPAGALVFDFAQKLQADLYHLSEKISDVKKQLSAVSLGTYDSVASAIYPDFFGQEMQHFKQLMISNDLEKLNSSFNAWNLDAVIIDSEFQAELSQPFKVFSLFSEPFYAVYALENQASTLAEHTLITPQLLSELDLLLFPDTCPIHRKVKRICEESGNAPKIHQIEFSSSAVSFALRTNMVAILPQSLAVSAVTKNVTKLGMRQLSNEFDRHLSLFVRNQEMAELLFEKGLSVL